MIFLDGASMVVKQRGQDVHHQFGAEKGSQEGDEEGRQAAEFESKIHHCN